MLLHPDDQYHNNQHSPGPVPIYKPAIWHCVSARNLPTSDGEDTTRQPNIACYLEDLLITGKDDEEHVTTLEKMEIMFKKTN